MERKMSETIRVAVCRLCQHSITHSLCTQHCANDCTLPQNRPQGSVEIQVFKYSETVPFDPRSAM